MELTVMTFNLRYHEPKDGANAWPNRIGRAVGIIRHNAPDVIGVQEGQQPMLLDLQERLPGYRWIGKPRSSEPGSEYCAVFYREDRLEALEDGQFWLSESPEEPGSKGWDTSITRICTWVRFRDKQTGTSFAVFNTHLDHRGAEARRSGAALVYRRMSDLRERLGIPVMLMGDMNCHPDAEPIRFLRGELEIGGLVSDLTDVFDKAEKPIGRTFNGFQGVVEGEPIDYIFVSRDLNIAGVKIDRTRYDDGYPSDHYPVVAVITHPQVP